MAYRTPIKAGQITVIGPGALEADTCTCCHCNRVWVTRDTKGTMDLGGWCRNCSRMICSDCAGKPCYPLERQIADMERKAKNWRELGIE